MGKKTLPAILIVLVAAAAGSGLLWILLTLRGERGQIAIAPSVPVEEAPEAAAAPATVAPAAPPAAPAQPTALVRQETPAETRTVAASKPAAEEAGETVSVAGRVLLPAGTPSDEELFVFATKAELEANDLYDDDGPGALAWREEVRFEGPLVARARADAGGSFRIEVPAGTREAHLAVAGRYAFSRRTTPVAPGAGEPAVLEPELGAWITGELRAPAGDDASLAEIEVELGPDLTASFDAFRIQHDAWEHQDESDELGRFEFRGVNTAIGHGVVARPERHAALVELGLSPRPGEHRRVELALARGATLRGRVVDEQGGPVAGAAVLATRPGVIGQAIGAVRETESGEDGGFVLEHVTAAELELTAEKEGLLRGRLRLEQPLEEGEERAGLELSMNRGMTISGTVRWPDGGPAPGVHVSARPDFSRAGGLGFAAAANATAGSATSDAEGRYSIGGLQENVYDLVARRKVEEGERAGTWKGLGSASAGEREVDLELEGLVPVVGRVVDEAGAPVERFTVSARKPSSGQFDFTTVLDRRVTKVDDEEGRFSLEDLESGTWELSVEAEGLASALVENLAVPRPPDAGELLVTLVPAAAVEGTVLGVGGRPVARALVSVEVDLMTRMKARGGEDLPRAWSDAEGRFRLALDPGEHTLIASQEGSAASEPLACEVKSGQVLEDVVLRLRQGATLRGLVLDEDGDPDPGRMVIVQRMPTYSSQKMETTDAEGRFLVERLEPGKWQVVSTKNFMAGELEDSSQEEMANDFLGSMQMDMVDLADGEERELVLGGQVGDPVKVLGRVLHAGEPVASAIVSAIPEDGNGMQDMKIKSLDAGGRFEMTLPRPGNYLMTVQITRGVGEQQSTELLEAIPEGSEEFELVIELPLGRIAGRVTGEDGEPLAECRVTLNAEGASYGSNLGGQYSEVVTGSDGRYAMEYLRPGSYTLAAGGVGFGGVFGGDAGHGRVVRGGVSLGEGESVENVDFRLAPPGHLAGSVLDQAGKPVADATVFVRDERGLPLEAFSLVGTDGSGRFAYRGLAPGSYTVSAKTDHGATPESAPVRVRGGETSQVTLTLGAGTILLVTVIDAEGNELGTRLSVVDAAGREYGSMRSLSELMERMGSEFSGKSHRIGPVPAGTYTLTATADDGREASKSVSLSDQEERRVKLRLK